MATDYISREAAIKEFCDDCMDREWCKSNGDSCSRIKNISAVPAADVVEVVRCRECINWNGNDCITMYGLFRPRPNDFCARGRKLEVLDDGKTT